MRSPTTGLEEWTGLGVGVGAKEGEFQLLLLRLDIVQAAFQGLECALLNARFPPSAVCALQSVLTFSF